MALLALGSDQVTKLRSAIQEFGSVEYFHLYEYRDHPTNMAAILRCIEALPTHTTATIFLFCLPQTIQHDIHPYVEQTVTARHPSWEVAWPTYPKRTIRFGPSR
eukprot:scaffold204102_cov28-Attheya_sp.AAC.2